MLFKVGEVSKKIGMSVRALHHYDEIGLLSPLHRSNAGYRLYSNEDLMQLQKIKSLQQLGFSLDEIQMAIKMNKPETSLLSILQKHIEKLSHEIKQQQVLIQRLQLLQCTLAQSWQPSVELLCESLKETIMYEKYFTADQLNQLAENRKRIGEDAIKAFEQEWREIFDKFKKLYEAKKPASCPEAQTLARRSEEMIDQFTGGNHTIRQSINHMYEVEGGDRVSQGGLIVDKAIFAYFSEACDLVKNK